MKNIQNELAKNEPPIEAKDLLAEIEPLLDDYFVGEICLDGEGINYVMPNGQKFIITAQTA